MGGRYKAYPEYQDTSGHWFGKIPKHWTATRLKRVCTLTTGITPSTENQSNFSDEPSEFPWVGPEDLDESGSPVRASNYLSELGWQRIRPIQENSVLICCIGTIGKIGFTSTKVSTNQQITAATFKKAARFNYYLLKAAKEILEVSATGNVLRILNSERLGGVRFIAAPDLESEAVANFLDHETAKIDTLIEKQQQLIQLLKEKRQAVISHAVTKGLNPNAKMRDSGVEWLGEVPEHWSLLQLRYMCSFFGGGTPSKENPDFWDGDIPWVSPKDMKTDYIFTAQDKITRNAVSQSATKMITEGAVLIVVRGMILDHSVPVALSRTDLTINQDMKALVPNSNIEGEYLLYCLKGMRDTILNLVESSAHGTKCLRTDQFERLEIPLPSFQEQRDIVKGVKAKLVAFDDLIAKAVLAIELASERRTALISAAVTGKIDVRDWVPPASDHRSEEAA